MTDMDRLKLAIRKLHGVDSRHRKSVRVREIFCGIKLWDGIVEHFDLYGHPTATRVYAWSYPAEDEPNRTRCVAVLNRKPVFSPETAVRAFISNEFRNIEVELEA